MNRWIGEHKAPPAEKHPVEGLHQGAVQRHLRAQDANVLDVTVAAAHDVSGISPFDLQHKVELGRKHLAAAQQPHERGSHEHFLEVALGQRLRKVGDLVDLEALVGLVDPPFARFQQRVSAQTLRSCRCHPCAARWRRAGCAKRHECSNL